MPVNRTILSSILTTMGISCDLAESGRECLAMCRTYNYDLVLLDHRMPEMDGVETLMHLKEIFMQKGRETPVICHTADEGKDYINLYKAAGFADVLIKPADPGRIAVMLMTYLPDGGYVLPAEEEKKIHAETELASLPEWLKTVPELDLMSGIKHCDTAADYLDALTVFTGSIKEKADDIERFEQEENWPMYLLRVHSLKSVANLIGALSVANKAADLEYAGIQHEYALVHVLTPALLEEYRSMRPLLEELLNKTDSWEVPSRRSILLVSNEPGIVGRGIIKSLEDEDFRVIQVKDVPEVILNHRADSDLFLYYPTGDRDHIKVISTRLAEMCRDDDKTLCLAGDAPDIEAACDIHDRESITSVYQRPINLERMAADMSGYYDMLTEDERMRTILVIDDDPDFLHIMDHWLSGTYHVDLSHSGAGALAYLDRKRPDLILLDYEMPVTSGPKVLEMIRSDVATADIPVMFLTGKGDKDSVIRVMQLRPVGYQLKSIDRATLRDNIAKFFASHNAG
jgi:CheY-like chemotaxis protein